MGELLLRSVGLGVCSSDMSPVSLISLKASLDPRYARPGKTSSTGFRGVRIRLGDPRGLAGRARGEDSKCPAALKPGNDWVRDIGGARALVEDFDRIWPREKGEVFRGRYGNEGEEEIGERGEEGVGSVDRRMVGGFLFLFSHSVL